MQYKSQILKTALFHTLFCSYFIFSLISLQNCKYNSDASTADQLGEAKKNSAKLMMNEFNAEVFNCNSSSILNKPTILDTVILGISHEGSANYLKAEILTSCGTKYFAKLKCSKEILGQFNETKTNRAFVAAMITRIDNSNFSVDVDTLDGKRNELLVGTSTLLTGECLAIRELPMALN